MRQVRRWLLTRADGKTEDVGAPNVEVLDSGALRFSMENHATVLIVAPGQWVEVCEAGYE